MSRILVSLLAVGLLSLGFVGSAAQPSAAPPDRVPAPPLAPSEIDFTKFLDANNINMCVPNLGTFASRIAGPGLEFPKGSGHTCVYTSGLWVGAKVDGQTRVAIGGYLSEFRPGCIYPDGTYDPDDDPRHHVYKIVKGDTLSPDYVNWPEEFGAPVGPDGRPLLTGEQTLWCVYHDADPAYHWAPEGGTAPLGIEVQQTAYAFGWQVAFGKAVYVEFTIINKLTNTLDSTYLGIFCDADVGTWNDDLVGCDSVLNLGFAYNADNSDTAYGDQPPCVGYDLLEGPMGDNGHEMPATSCRCYNTAQDPASYVEAYNCLKGLGLAGNAIIDPTTGNPTTFEKSGDPVAGTGWIDVDGGDRRFILASGPFTMAPGDTQHIALAIIVARGRNRLASVKLMKEFDQVVQAAYDTGFKGQFLPIAPGQMANGGGGLLRGDSQPLDINAAQSPTQAAFDFGVTIASSPCTDCAELGVRVAQPGAYALQIIDICGRLVSTVYQGDLSGDADRFVWDGRTSGGLAAPAGIYFARLADSAGRTRAAAKIVLLR